MAEPVFVYENFIHQIIPETCLHRLGHYRNHLAAWAGMAGKPLWWVLDPGRDTFIVEAPSLTQDSTNPQLVPVFLLGRRGDNFSVEFYDFRERRKLICDRLLFKYSYCGGMLRLPEHLRADTDNIHDLVLDAVRAHCETRLMRADAEAERPNPSLLEGLNVDIKDTKYYATV